MVLGGIGLPLDLVIPPLGWKQELDPVTAQHHSMVEYAQGMVLRRNLVTVRTLSNQHTSILIVHILY